MRLFIASFAVLLALCVAPARADDRGERLAVAKDLLVAMHVTDTAKQVLPAMMEQIKIIARGAKSEARQGPRRDIGPRMQAKFVASLDELIGRMAAVYADKFQRRGVARRG